MRVLHIYSGNLYGGVEKTAVTILRLQHLCPMLDTHYALCFEGRLSQELTALGRPAYMLGEVRVRHPLSVWRARRRLLAFLKKEHFDVVVCQSPWSLAIFGTVVRAVDLPLVFWQHDFPTGRHWLERWAGLNLPDLALCNSKFTAKAFSAIYPQVPVEVFYNPVESHALSLSEEERRILRGELNTPADATVIIQVSRMEKWKGHELHLRSLNLLRDTTGWVCWIVGGPQRPYEEKYFDELVELARQLGITDRVRFLGQRTDINYLLAVADIHCQPNLRPEPFGNAFVEGLSARLPVVTTAMGGACEIIDDTCGVLVPPDNIAALAYSLRRLIEQPNMRAQLGANGPARARQICDPHKQINLLHHHLSTIASRREAA